MHQPPVDSLCLQRASTAGMRQPPGGGKYGSSKVASRNGTPNIDRARARVTERRTRTVRISCTSRLRIARTIFRRVIAALTSAKIPRNRRPGRRTTYTQSTVALGHSLSNFQRRTAVPPVSAAKASMIVPAIGRAQLSHAGHDGCRSRSSFSCFPVIRRRYKTSSPCVNGARFFPRAEDALRMREIKRLSGGQRLLEKASRSVEPAAFWEASCIVRAPSHAPWGWSAASPRSCLSSTGAVSCAPRLVGRRRIKLPSAVCKDSSKGSAGNVYVRLDR